MILLAHIPTRDIAIQIEDLGLVAPCVLHTMLDSAVVFLLVELDLIQPNSTITIVVASPRDTRSCSKRRADLTALPRRSALEVVNAVIYYCITTDTASPHFRHELPLS
jgi:hypothetical protein